MPAFPLHLMRHRATVQRASRTTTGGETRLVYADVATGVPCLVQQERGRTQASVAGVVLEYDVVVYLRPDQDVRPRGQHDAKDRLVLTAPTSVAGDAYVVEHVADEAGQDHHRTAFCRRLAGATAGGA